MAMAKAVPAEVLVERYLAGSDQAAAELLECYGGMAYAVICHLLPQQADADDVYQEACIKTFAGLRNLRDPARFGGWFKQIAIRTAVDHGRKRRIVQSPLDERLADVSPGPETCLLQTAEQLQVQTAVAELPEHYRQVIVLFYWSECSYQEIADALNIPKGTVMSRLHKAKALLQSRLEPTQAKEGNALWI